MSPTATTLGLIVPIGSSHDPRTVRALIAQRVISSVWVRDLPVVSAEDGDAGQGSDPWWYLGRLCAADPLPEQVGTASVILGIRHPLVVARAALGAQVDTGGRFVLGVGSGGKPEMNEALGVAGRSYTEFASQWTQLRHALQDQFSQQQSSSGLSMHPPPGYQPPPMYLATSDPLRWQAIQGAADGWQTFLTDDRPAFERRYAEVCAARGSETPTDLRLDVQLLADQDAAPAPVFTHPARGRVTCAASQLPGLVKPWLDERIGRLLLRVDGARGIDPVAAVRHLHAACC